MHAMKPINFVDLFYYQRITACLKSLKQNSPVEIQSNSCYRFAYNLIWEFI